LNPYSVVMTISETPLDPLGVKPLLARGRRNPVTGPRLSFFNPER
jgi:hypothetical protein